MPRLTRTGMTRKSVMALREGRGVVIDQLSTGVLMPITVAEALEAYVKGDHFDVEQIDRFLKAMEARPSFEDDE